MPIERTHTDTSPEAERILIEGFRAMSPREKMARVAAMNQTVAQFARARIRRQYGSISDREMRLRLAALRLDRDTMIRVFNWDPEEKGY